MVVKSVLPLNFDMDSGRCTSYVLAGLAYFSDGESFWPLQSSYYSY